MSLFYTNIELVIINKLELTNIIYNQQKLYNATVSSLI